MPSIEELLNEAESHMAAQPVNDVLEIDPETREISIPDSEIILGVETDQKAERKYFHCPKIVGNNIDLSALELYVVFQNASNKEEGKDRYHVTDVSATSDGYITFSWELSAKVTEYKGDVQFVVCAIKTDSSGVKQNVWNTTIAIGKCLIGLSSDMSASEEQSASDLYTQLISELNSTASAKMSEVTTQIQTVGQNQVSNVNSAGATQVNNVQDKGTEVLASIPDTYTELDASVKQLSYQMRGKAPVIVESITSQYGKPVSVSDSAEMPLQGLRVYGKSGQITTTGAQIFDNFSDTLNEKGITVSKEKNGLYRFKGTATGELHVKLASTDALEIGKQYTFSGGSGGESRVHQTYLNNGVEVIAYTVSTRTFTAETSKIICFVAIYSGSTVDFTVKPMLNEGDTALPFEPYTGGKPSPSPEFPQEIKSIASETNEIGVKVIGKNLFGGKAFADKIVELGGTLQETDKMVHVSASAIRGKEVFVFPDNSKQYTLIFNGKNTVSDTFFLNMLVEYADGTKTNLIFKDNKKLVLTTIKDKKIKKLVGIWQSGEVSFYYDQCGIFEGVITEDDFEPYKQSTATIPLSNGLPGIPVTTDGNYTDENGQQYICDEIDFKREKYVQRVWKSVFDGSEDEKWRLYATHKGFLSAGLPETMNSRIGFCNIFPVRKYENSVDESIIYGSNGKNIYVVNSSFFDDSLDDNGLSNWKAYLAEHPLKVMTYLDTPIETDLTEAQIQAYKSLTTFKPTSIISNDANAQMNVEYAADTKTWVTNKINTLIKEAITS